QNLEIPIEFLYMRDYNRLMKFFAKKRKILIIIIGILVILSLNFYQKEVKGFFYLISSPVQKSLWGAGDRISDFFEAIAEIKELKKENEALKLKVQELLSENSSLKELRKENQTLREALEIGLRDEFKLVLAEVIGKDIDQDSILINKGSKDGLSKDLPVITQQRVLLGRIIEVYENFSRVLLISNKESSFDGEIPEKEISGVVKGRGSLKMYLDLISKDKEVKEEDLVVSSALGGIFPNGLLVGLIKEVKKSDLKPFQQA
ncbi:unnamed protein product, partial [marine sediment metagenome]